MRILMVLALVACSKTSTPTPDNTGSGGITGGVTSTIADAAAPAVGSGSGVGAGAGSGDKFDDALAQLDGLRGKMCACKDAACATAVMDEYKTWRMAMKQGTHGLRPNKQQDDRGNALDKQLRACRATAEAGVTAVGSGSGSGGGDPLDKALGEYEGFRTKMCACANKACADKVQDEVKAWDRAVRSATTAKPTAAQMQRASTIDKAMADCRKKAESATPGTAGAGAKIDAMLAKLAAFRDQMCACKDKACAGTVDKAITDFQLAASKDKDLADAKPTKDQDDKADKLAAEMKACVAKLK